MVQHAKKVHDLGDAAAGHVYKDGKYVYDAAKRKKDGDDAIDNATERHEPFPGQSSSS